MSGPQPPSIDQLAGAVEQLQAQLSAATKRATELCAEIAALEEANTVLGEREQRATKRAEAAEGALKEFRAFADRCARDCDSPEWLRNRARALTGEGAERAQCPSCNRTSLPHARGCPLAPATLEQKEG